MRRAAVALMLLVAAPEVVVADDAPRLPNVIFLLADDLGFADPHCCGHPYARTPNIDRLAEEGTRFTQFYVTGITCCPSRTGFMTSRFPARFPTYPAVGGFGDHPTVTQLLQRAGYATGHIGKWHIGPNDAAGTYGIDVTPASESHLRTRNDERGRDASIYDAAIRFVERNRDRPFYLNVWGHISHHPVDPPQAVARRFQDVVVHDRDFPVPMQEKLAIVKSLGGDVNESMRNYLGDLSSLDDSVGRLLTRLDELGLTENTIVVFSSDHGSPSPSAPKRRPRRGTSPEGDEDDRINLVGFNGNLRGGKHSLEEGGIRVPFIIRWPGRVTAGRVDEVSVTSGIDWLPTICHVAGIEATPGQFDGENVSGAWRGGVHIRRRPLFWKASSPKADMAVRDGPWKLVAPGRRAGQPQLYDVVADPLETKDVATMHPDVAQRLTKMLQQWDAALPREYVKAGGDD